MLCKGTNLFSKSRKTYKKRRFIIRDHDYFNKYAPHFFHLNQLFSFPLVFSWTNEKSLLNLLKGLQ